MSGILQGVLASIGGAPATYIEDVFSTYLYTGNGGTQTITNGVDLAGKGGLVWFKNRNLAGFNHALFDTVRGVQKVLCSNNTTVQETETGGLTTFNSTGFTVGPWSAVNYNSTAQNCSWTFRKAPKFFDVVTYTGNGDADRNITHNLGSVPGMIFIKKTSGTGNWAAAVSLSSTVYGIGGGGSGSGYELSLDLTDGYYDNPLKSTIATDTTVNVPRVYYNNASICNASGATYVMYLFASNAGGFGLTGTDNIISCGAFTTTSGGAVPTVTLGYEPQFLMFKCASAAGNWNIIDNMRGFSQTQSLALFPNASSAETNYGIIAKPTATGFTSGDGVLAGSQIFTYMAIRRGPMKTPTSGTEVFVPDAAGANASANGEVFSSTFPVDFHFRKDRISSNDWFSNSRLVPSSSLKLNTTAAEAALAYVNLYDRMTGIGTTNAFNYTDWAGWLFKRAPGFFDISCYTVSGTTPVGHNLGVRPEMVIYKTRNRADAWYVLVNQDGFGTLNGSSAWGGLGNGNGLTNIAQATSTTVSNQNGFFLLSGDTVVVYLFATVAGVSKVGSYTGTGSTLNINAGLPTGARFVLIKRTDSTGDWWTWDTARGMVASTDPRLALNSTAAEINNDWVYTTTNGFQIVTTDATVNASGGSYIYLAIA